MFYNCLMTRLVQFKFKPAGKDIWLSWAEELKRRKEEVIATLKDEGVVSEACFMAPDGESVFYFMESKDFEKVADMAAQSGHTIDVEHKKAREQSLEFVAELTCLFNFENR